MQPKYSWSEIVQTANNVKKEKTLADNLVDLLKNASTQDRQEILKLYSNLLGIDYSEEMIRTSDLEVFKEIFSSWSDDELQEQYHIISNGLSNKTAKSKYQKSMEIEGDDRYPEKHYEYSKDDEDDEDDDSDEDDKKEACYSNDTFDNLMRVIASWTPEDRKQVYEVWRGLLGEEYTNSMVKDYIPKGKARDVSKPQSSGQTEAKSNDDGLKQTASKKDRTEVANLYRGLWGSNFVDKLTELYSNKNGKTVSQKKQTSGQTKTSSSYDPWGLNKDSKKNKKKEA